MLIIPSRPVATPTDYKRIISISTGEKMIVAIVRALSMFISFLQFRILSYSWMTAFNGESTHANTVITLFLSIKQDVRLGSHQEGLMS